MAHTHSQCYNIAFTDTETTERMGNPIGHIIPLGPGNLLFTIHNRHRVTGCTRLFLQTAFSHTNGQRGGRRLRPFL